MLCEHNGMSHRSQPNHCIILKNFGLSYGTYFFQQCSSRNGVLFHFDDEAINSSKSETSQKAAGKWKITAVCSGYFT